jgi:CRP/FNR family transcriptional regulator, cyclic AMP receptor protein
MDYVRLSNEECLLLEKIGTMLFVKARQVVYKKGDPADKVFYVKKGRVRMYDHLESGREITLDVFESNHIFGESAFAEIDGGKPYRPVFVEAVTDTILIALDTRTLAYHLTDEPALALHLLQLCSDSMDRLTVRVEDQCSLDRFGKTAAYLLDVTATESEERGTMGGRVPYTHGDLADALGLNRTTVSAVLKYFDQKKWISCGYGEIHVVNREALAQFVDSQRF